MNAAATLRTEVGNKPACEALKVPRATFYRRLRVRRLIQRRPGGQALPGADKSKRGRRWWIFFTQSAFRTMRLTRPMPCFSMKDSTTAPSGPCTGYWPPSTAMSKSGEDRSNGLPIKARASGHRPQSGVVVGHHQAERTGEVDLFLPLRDHGHFQPLRRGLDGGPSGTAILGQTSHRTERSSSRAFSPAN